MLLLVLDVGNTQTVVGLYDLEPGADAAGVPKDVVNRLSSEVANAVASPYIKSRFESLGIEPVGGTPEHASAFLNGDNTIFPDFGQ